MAALTSNALTRRWVEFIPSVTADGVVRWCAFVNTDVELCAVIGIHDLIPFRVAVTVGLARVLGEHTGGTDHLQEGAGKVQILVPKSARFLIY